MTSEGGLFEEMRTAKAWNHRTPATWYRLSRLERALMVAYERAERRVELAFQRDTQQEMPNAN